MISSAPATARLVHSCLIKSSTCLAATRLHDSDGVDFPRPRAAALLRPEAARRGAAPWADRGEGPG